MYKVAVRQNNREQRKLRVRRKISGTVNRPRLSVFRSLKYTYATLIDDTTGRVIADTSAEVKKLHTKGPKVMSAFEVGKLLAKKALEKDVKTAVFDRNGYRYHGRVKSLADGAREGGLKF